MRKNQVIFVEKSKQCYCIKERYTRQLDILSIFTIFFACVYLIVVSSRVLREQIFSIPVFPFPIPAGNGTGRYGKKSFPHDFTRQLNILSIFIIFFTGIYLIVVSRHLFCFHFKQIFKVFEIIFRVEIPLTSIY